MPIIALLLFGGSTLKDFAFALLIGVASGAYSSIFIASPVLTHWKEREAHYRTRRERITAENGFVPAYAGAGADIDPGTRKPRRAGRITTPEPETVSAAEFEQMKRDLGIEEERPVSRQTSTLTKRLARKADAGAAPAQTKRGSAPSPRTGAAPGTPPAVKPAQAQSPPAPGDGDGAAVEPAPDIPENEGMVPSQKPKRPAKSRNRRHGRRR
jgi:SecD/SecF fusion protein